MNTTTEEDVQLHSQQALILHFSSGKITRVHESLNNMHAQVVCGQAIALTGEWFAISQGKMIKIFRRGHGVTMARRRKTTH